MSLFLKTILAGGLLLQGIFAGTPPVNDHYTDATEISGNPAVGDAVLDFATRDPGEAPFVTNALTGGKTVWWKWRAPSDGRALLYVTNTTIWPVLAVSEGSSLVDAAAVELTVPAAHVTNRTSFTFFPDPPSKPYLEQWVFSARKNTLYTIGLDATQSPTSLFFGATPELGTSGGITLSLNFMAAPAGDSFADAALIPSSATSFQGDVNGARSEPHETLQPGAVGRTIWFKWSAPSNGMYTFEAREAGSPVILTLFRGTTLTALTPVKTTAALWLSSCGDFWRTQPVAISARADETLYLQADTLETQLTGTFEFNFRYTSPPPNDDFSHGTIVGGNVLDFEASNAGATTEPGERLATTAGGSSVWYRWKATGIGSITLSTNQPLIFPVPTVINLPSLFDTPPDGITTGVIDTIRSPDCMETEAKPNIFQPVFSIYAVGTDSVTTVLASGPNPWARVETGQEYAIALDSVGGIPGTTRMTLAFNPIAPNDNFDDATRISGGHVLCRSYTLGASVEPGEPAHEGKPAANSLWWSWTAPSTGPVSISSLGRLGVYVGAGSVSNLVPVTAISAREGSISFQAERSTVYSIAQDTKNNFFAVYLELEMIPPTILLSRNIENPIGHAWFLLKETTGVTIAVDFSPDLRTWTRISTNVLKSDITRFLFPVAAGERYGFARAFPIGNP